MLASYGKAYNSPFDIQFENIIIDTTPSKVGSFKISLPASIRGIGKPVEKILLEATLAHREPREKLRLALSVNGVVVTREIRPARSVEVDGIHWSTQVFDITELLRNKLRRLFQVIKVYVNGSEVEKIGHLALMVSHEVSDALSSFEYLVGPHLMRENNVMRLNIPYAHNNRGFNKTYFLHKTLLYSPIPRGDVQVRIGGHEFSLPKKAGYTEISYEKPVESLSLEIGNKEGGSILFNSISLHALYRIPHVSISDYNIMNRASKDRVDIRFSVTLSNHSSSEEVQAQFIIIGEGTPLGRIVRRINPEKEGSFNLYFKDLPRINEYVLRVILTKYSRTWIRDYPIKVP